MIYTKDTHPDGTIYESFEGEAHEIVELLYGRRDKEEKEEDCGGQLQMVVEAYDKAIRRRG